MTRMGRRWSLVAVAVLWAGACSSGTRSAPVDARRIAPARPWTLPAARPAGAELQAALAAWRAAPEAELPRATMVVALVDDPALVDHLLVELAGPRAVQAASALGIVPGDAALEALLVALDHADPHVRERAASRLRVHRDPRAIPRLIAALPLQSGDPVDGQLCRELVRAIGATATPASAATVQRAMVGLPRSCGVGDVDLASIEHRLGDEDALAMRYPTITRTRALFEPDRELVEQRARSGLRPLMVERARANLESSTDAMAIQAAADVLADDAAAKAIVRARIDEVQPDACDGSDGVFSQFEGDCGELHALVGATARMHVAEALPWLRSLTARAARTEGAQRLRGDALGARALLEDDSVAAEIRAAIGGPSDPVREELAAGAAVKAPLVREALLAAPPESLARFPACAALLHLGESARRSEVAAAVARNGAADTICRQTAVEVLAASNAPADREVAARTVADALATPARETWAPVGWVERVGRLPAEGRPPWSALAAALLREEGLHTALQANSTYFDPSWNEVILEMRSATATPYAPGLAARIRAVSAVPPVAGRVVRELLEGAPDEDVAGRLGSLLPDEPFTGASAPVRALAKTRLLAGALASRDARAEAFVADLVARETSSAVRDALFELVGPFGDVPVAGLVPYLATPDDRTTALLAARCDAACGPKLRPLLAGAPGPARDAAAVVAVASGVRPWNDPALRDAVDEALEYDEGDPCAVPYDHEPTLTWAALVLRRWGANGPPSDDDDIDDDDARPCFVQLQSAERVLHALTDATLPLETLAREDPSWLGAEGLRWVLWHLPYEQLVALTQVQSATSRAAALAAIRTTRSHLDRATVERLARDADENVRADLLTGLPERSDHEALCWRGLRDPSGQVRSAATRCLTARSAGLERLFDAMADPDQDVRRDVLRAIGETRPRGAARRLRALLAARPVPPEVVYALARLGAATDLPALLEAYRALPAEERPYAEGGFRRATHLLGSDLRGARATLADREPHVATLGLAMAADLRGRRLHDVLALAARHPSPEIRRQVVRRLIQLLADAQSAQETAADEVWALVRRLLADRDVPVRCEMLLSLAAQPFGQSTIDTLLAREHVDLRTLLTRRGCSPAP